MEVEKLNNPAIRKRGLELRLIGKQGVEIALKENRDKGIASVFIIKGKIYYKFSNGLLLPKNRLTNYWAFGRFKNLKKGKHK